MRPPNEVLLNRIRTFQGTSFQTITGLPFDFQLYGEWVIHIPRRQVDQPAANPKSCSQGRRWVSTIWSDGDR